MKYDKMVGYFESDEKILELLDYLSKNYFDIIDDYKEQLLQDILSTFEELIQVKRVLAGIISSLEPIYSKSLTLKKQKEYQYTVTTKKTCEETGEKYIDGYTEKAAKNSVKNYRDIRDILKGYLNAANGLYYDIRDTLDRMKKGYNRDTE